MTERTVLIICATAFLFHLTHALSAIDTTEPIVRAAPVTLDADGYFGYSVVLHRKSDGPRIIVSAPNGTAEGGVVENLGVIFECPISQGSCKPLIDNNIATGNDRRLYDIQNNDVSEVKEHQFLGVSMKSDRNFFVVCAHRHIDRGYENNQRHPLGKCYFTENEDLIDFQVYEPCLGIFRSCQAGTSAALARNSDDSVSIALGAPGTDYNKWRGAIFCHNPMDGSTGSFNFGPECQGSECQNFTWQGYAITSGHLISKTEYHFAISVTRSFNYTGHIIIYSNTLNLDVVMQNLRGTQMGEYYGFSLETVDLNGDGYDELLVGAPMYSIRGVPEVGRVFIYKNNKGSLTLFETITGDKQPYTRFGHAITNLGDINGDNYEDFAVSAPFGSSPGSVYIYHGSLTLTQTIMGPVQVIRGENVVDGLTGVSMPVGFGSSLASLLDVDDNGVNDLAVGAFQSQQVFLFRSRATARIITQLRSIPAIIDLMNENCMLNETNYTCFDIEICARYPRDDLLPPTIDVTFHIVVDERGVSGLMERVFFEGLNSNTKAVTQTLARGMPLNCQHERVFVRNDITDTYNGFGVDVAASGPSFTPNTNDGNPVPTDFSPLPIVITSPEVLALQVELFRDCNGTICVPDLAIDLRGITYKTSSGENTDTFVAGLITSFSIDLSFSNLNPDHAFAANLEIEYPSAFVRIEPMTVSKDNNVILITSPPTTSEGVTTQKHLIGNPLSGNQQRDIRVRFRPLTTITGNEGSFEIIFRATSINNENASTLANNEATQTVSVNARADITLDQAVADPEQLTYVSPRDINVTTVMDLGPGVTVSFLVLNLGPSTIPSTRMSIFWPYRAVDSSYYYLYPAQLMVSSSFAFVSMNNTFINPDSILLSTTPSPGAVEDGKKKKRRRRSILPIMSHKQLLHRKRQLNSTDIPVQVNDITVDCRESNAECVELTFTITQLPGDSSVQIDVISYLDERYFQNRVDRFTFIASANLSINNSESAFIIQPANDQQDGIDVHVRVIPFVPMRGTGNTSTLLAIILPIVFGVILIVILGIVLYLVGFFKRKHKQKKEEIQAEILGEMEDEFPTQELSSTQNR